MRETDLYAVYQCNALLGSRRYNLFLQRNEYPEHLRVSALSWSTERPSDPQLRRWKEMAGVHLGRTPSQLWEANSECIYGVMQYWKISEGGSLVSAPDMGLSITDQPATQANVLKKFK